MNRMLDARSITFQYLETALRFERIRFHVCRGEIVGLVGESGIGKSTLAMIVTGLWDNKQGDKQAVMEEAEVFCDERRVIQPDASVALVLQEYRGAVLPWLTVRQNLELGYAKARGSGTRRFNVDQVAALLGIEEKLDSYPFKLSAGQVQRVQVGRTLLTGADFLVLDEPTSSLDSESKRMIYEALIGIVRDHEVGVLLLTHDIDDVVYLSHRLYLATAQECGTVELTEVAGYGHANLSLEKARHDRQYQEIHRCVCARLFGPS